MTRAKLPVFSRARTAALMLCAATAIGAFSTRAAQAQVVYDSTASPTLPAAALLTGTGNGGTLQFAIDDYVTSLATLGDPDPNFQLASLTFFGGVEFTGPSTRENSTLVFRFLRSDGAPVPENRTEVQFAQSGSFLQTVQINALVPKAGFIEVTTLPNSGTNGFFAFAQAPTVGSNNPAVGNSPGVRAFQLTAGAAAAAPEPGTFALFAGAALPIIGLASRRRSA